MKLKLKFYRLPVLFDVRRLQQEVSQFNPSQWRDHPQSFDGNNVVHFITVDGSDNDTMLGPMASTRHLALCAYIQQVLASFNTPIGRSRLMMLAPGTNVPEHTDIHYYWQRRIRIHIPIVTDPAVIFFCDDEPVHMAAGEAWIFDNWRQHKVVNDSECTRIHLVIDTVGSAKFWQLVRQGKSFGKQGKTISVNPKLITYSDAASRKISLEKQSLAVVMHPSEVDQWGDFLTRELLINTTQDRKNADDFEQMITDFKYDWRACYVEHGESRAGFKSVKKIIHHYNQCLSKLSKPILLVSNHTSVLKVFKQWLDVAFNPHLSPVESKINIFTPSMQKIKIKKKILSTPIFLVSAPRSGSTLLFETLASAESIWTIGGESHGVFENIAALHPSNQNFFSNRLTDNDVTPDIVRQLNVSFIKQLRDHQGKRYLALNVETLEAKTTAHFLEKTPKNSLRISFLKKAYPEARFIFLHRHPRDNISSIIDAWRSQRFITYGHLPGWKNSPWSLLLTPGWQELLGKPLEDIAAHQWVSANQHIIDDLAVLPECDWCQISYEDVLKDTAASVENLCHILDIPFDQSIADRIRRPLPNSKFTVTPPQLDKWKKNTNELARVMPSVESLAKKLGYSSIFDGILDE